jgi:hypothetical protein
VNELFNAWGSDWILVSGGSDGTCHVAEQTAMEFGIPVISFRIAQSGGGQQDDEYRVEEWRLYRGTGKVVHHEPTWADWQSATNYKALLIAERADSADAFHANNSRGTAFEIECFGFNDVPCEVWS